MILGTIDNCERYYILNPLFKRAFEFIKNNNLKDLAEGKYEIDGKDLFAIISTAMGRKREDALLESHRKYIDIQFLADGDEEIGWKPLSQCHNNKGYDDEKDVDFFEDKPLLWFKLKPNNFTIFFPEDAHLPMVSDRIVKKVVIKVSAKL